MAPTSRPDRPVADGDSETWWAAIADRTLMVNRCKSCGRTSLYPRPFCPHCWSDEVRLVPTAGRARLYTWSVVRQNAAPFDADLPYVVAMVDLEEGPRLMTRVVDCAIDDLHADMQLVIDFREGDDGFVVPVFRPDPGKVERTAP